MKKFFSIPVFLCILLLTASCTRNNAQRDFEQDAYTEPAGYTETNAQTEIISLDEDDWRTSPLFQGLVNIIPAYPNPVATNQSVQFDVELTGVNSVNGLEVLVRYPDNTFGTLYQNFETLNPGITPVFINPLELGIDGSPEAARGLKRIFIFDGNSQMISYGDIMVE
jgi:hypothetical protein